ncbi:hypothetical protein AGMMS49965_02480 [Bacteroidia bacterium]|nr:hypothetical protein AGMMS49965_02480 [Bacteroidia bacterium]
MSNFNLGYHKAVGTRYDGRIQKIAKSTDKLRPIYEAFINSYEAIKNIDEGKIVISIQFNKTLFFDKNEDLEFDSITIEDNGIGFNDDEFTRFLTLDDTSKGLGNKGSGRIQFIHHFEKAEYESVFEDTSSATGFKRRIFMLSKIDAFLQNNAIVRLDKEEECIATASYTILKLSNPLETNTQKQENREYFKTLSTEDLKKNIKNHYLALFCDNRNNLPQIKLQRSVNGVIDSDNEKSITQQDIPNINKSEDINVYYSKINMEGKIEKSTKTEVLNLKCFKINQNELAKNSIRLVSKGEMAKEIKLDSIASDDLIDNNRYLFLLSGTIIDNADTDTRGHLYIPTEKEFKKSFGEPNLFPEEIITIDEIRETTNEKIDTIYPEIIEYTKQKQIGIDELRDMFLLSDETIKRAKIKPLDDEETALEKIYKADSELVAKKDIEIKKRIDALNQLTPNRTDYQEKLEKEVKELTKVIPLQNRTSLTQYVARRKMVLELFQKVLDKEIEKFKDGGSIDEKIMHNLIFQQSSNSPEESDLWLINEEFIYFKGTSESMLQNLKYEDDFILKRENSELQEDKLSEEEKAYCLKTGGNDEQRRTDILLFPKEGKCIIIELKAPDVDVSKHLNQINRYASLINNLSKNKYKFNTYYGYLIGENVDINAIEDNDTDFISAHNLNYIFRPYKRIAGKFGKNNGSLYTEVIKYSTLLERAKLRNKIFIDKLER